MDQKQQIVDRLKQANNILVTVSNNPSVDQLASCIGLTLTLNKMGKHGTAVFSGSVPDTLEFLEPEKTIETNTDSLRDFIIALDKSKADKLRYKVEDKVVKIFITPYRTSIDEKDLEFSQGDFNVDVVIALGVHDQAELDQAITAHGRILHDATIITVNVKPGGELGSINWLVPGASCLSELAVDLINAMDKNLLDDQISTAFLTGIVAETKRFSNEKTSPDTMSISAQLMAAGANQQLVATKLEPPPPPPPPTPEPQPAPPPPPPPPAPAAEPERPEQSYGDTAPAESQKPEDGTLEIPHNLDELAEDNESKKEEPEATPQIHIDDQGSLRNIEKKEEGENQEEKPPETEEHGGSRMILQPPSMSGPMTALGMPEEGSSSSDPLTLPKPSDQSEGEAETSGAPFGSPASANISAPTMPFMPQSMTPGGPSQDSGTLPQHSAPDLVPPTAQGPPPLPTPGDKSFDDAGSNLFASSKGNTIMPPPQNGPPDLVPSTPSPDTSHVDNARDAVNQAVANQPYDPNRPEPIQALNAQPLGDPLHLPPTDSPGTPPDLNLPVPATASVGQPTVFSPTALGSSPPPVPPPLTPPQ